MKKTHLPEYFTKYKVFIFFTVILLNSCNSTQKTIVGTWKLSAIIKSNDSYATRSSLVPQNIQSNTIINFKKNGTFTSNENYCFDGIKREEPSSGTFYIKNHNRTDKIFTLESSKCPGIGSDLNFTLRDKHLELNLPSAIGYQIQIFERQK